MKNYVLSLLTQVTSWLAVAFLLLALLAPRDWIILLAVVLFFVDEAWLRKMSLAAKAQVESWLA